MRQLLLDRVTSYRALVLALLGAPLLAAAGLAIEGSMGVWAPIGVATGYVLGAAGWFVADRARHVRTDAPSNLPPPPTSMVGREDDVDRLCQYLIEDGGGRRRIALVSGVAGVGKTAFALHVAHRVAQHFPGGELFAQFDSDMAPTASVRTVRRRFVLALAGPDRAVPFSAHRQAAMYRRLTGGLSARRRLLMVFDDVMTADLVLPLLPDSPWCAVLITAREPLPQLKTFPVALEELDPEPAVRMLGAIIGAERVERERAMALMIVQAAAGHPLAIQLVGMALAARPNTRLSAALNRMRQGGTFGAALNVSYAMLSSSEQEALTQIGFIPNRQFEPWELAAVLGGEDGEELEAEAWLLCDRLTDAGLLERFSRDAAGVQLYRSLEHVQGYARKLAGRRSRAEAEVATQALQRKRARRKDPIDADDIFERIQARVHRGELAGAFDESRQVISHARDSYDFVAEAEATAMLAELHSELGGLDDVDDLLRLPMRSGYQRSMIRAWRIDAWRHRRLRHLGRARRSLREARRLLEGVPDRIEHIRTLREAALVASISSRASRGHRLLDEADQLCRAEPRQRAGIAYARGRVLLAEGNNLQAERFMADAAAEAADLGQPLWVGWLNYQRSITARHDGRYDDALYLALTALQHFDDMSHRYGRAHCRQEAGKALAQQGYHDGAALFLSEALETFHSCGDPWAEAGAAEELAGVQELRHADDHVLQLLGSARRMYASIGADWGAMRVRRRLNRLQRRPDHVAAGAS